MSKNDVIAQYTLFATKEYKMLSKYEIIKSRSYIINPIKKNIRSSCMRNRLQNWINENGDKLSLNNLIKNKNYLMML